MLELKPDICSLDMGSLNMGSYVFINTPGICRPWRSRSATAGVLPELEVFETGHLLLAKRMDRDRPHQGARHVPDLFSASPGASRPRPRP